MEEALLPVKFVKLESVGECAVVFGFDKFVGIDLKSERILIGELAVTGVLFPVVFLMWVSLNWEKLEE